MVRVRVRVRVGLGLGLRLGLGSGIDSAHAFFPFVCMALAKKYRALLSSIWFVKDATKGLDSNTASMTIGYL